MYGHKDTRKVIILGIDAMDPEITERLIAEGRLPNFSRLKNEGSYSRLTVKMPSETAVVWSSFATGSNAGSHGVFDFIMRDPKNYFPYLSLNEIRNYGGKVDIRIRRKQEPFWSILSKHKVPSFVYLCPNTFPPDSVSGKMLSGMGVPDISGTMGKFSFYTTKPQTAEDEDTRGRVINIKIENNLILTDLYGPKVMAANAAVESTLPLKIILQPDKEGIVIQLLSKEFFIKKGNWSDWQRGSFKVGGFKRVYGIAKFYLKSIAPEFELYVSPINFDPLNPPFAISYPHNYSKELADKIGLYYTQGMPYDTWPLTEDRLDEQAFLEHADQVLSEQERILKEGLREFKGGTFFFYLETIDIIQHMFWRYIDSKHPLYKIEPVYQDIIFRYYERMDQILGEILKVVDKDTVFIALSDHGFTDFRRSVHLNRWLLDNGYLFLRSGADESKGFFDNVDWSKTKAYALGFGGIYLNRIGREGEGIVSESEAGRLKQAIKEGLEKFQDPKDLSPVVSKVYTQEEIFSGPYMKDSPDLFVGFNRGFRSSWQTALGGVPKLLIEDNKKKWSGDHLVDPALVPGVIFTNKKIGIKEPTIIDVAPTVLSLFNIKKPKEMPGRYLFLGPINER